MSDSCTRSVFKDTVKHTHTYQCRRQDSSVLRRLGVREEACEGSKTTLPDRYASSKQKARGAGRRHSSVCRAMDSRAFPTSIMNLDFSLTITYHNCLFSLFVYNFEILKQASIIPFLTQCNFKSVPRPPLVARTYPLSMSISVGLS